MSSVRFSLSGSGSHPSALAEPVAGKTNSSSLRHPSACLAATSGRSLFKVGQSASPFRQRDQHRGATPDASIAKALGSGSSRTRCRSRRWSRRAGVGAEVRRKESEVREASSPAADGFRVVTQCVGSAKATREETEVRESDRSAVVVVGVAEVSAIVCVGVILLYLRPLNVNGIIAERLIRSFPNVIEIGARPFRQSVLGHGVRIIRMQAEQPEMGAYQ
jgi:hypothetical protein